MSFNSFETSQESGQPVEIFEIVIGGVFYRYTSDPVDVVVGGITYEAIPIKRGKIVVSQEESSGDRLEIIIPASDPLAQNYIDSVPGQKATLIVRRFHRNDLPNPESVVIFKGSIATIRLVEDGYTAKMTVIPITSAQSRPIPRLTFSGLCNHMLYDDQCGVDETSATWRKTYTCTAVTSNRITVPGAGLCGADFFEGGFVTSEGDYRLVVQQAGDDLVLSTPFSISPLNKSVRVNAGCKHRVADCRDKFSNIENFGGFPFVPLKNPFESGID